MSNKVMIGIVLVAVAATVGVIWYVSRSGVVETEKEYVLPESAQIDRSLGAQADSVDAPKRQNVMNADELKALDSLIEKLENIEESSSVDMEEQETVLGEPTAEEKEESSVDTLSVNNVGITRQQFQSIWQEKIEIGNELLNVLHGYKADIDEILSQPLYTLDEVIKVRNELHETRNKLADVTVFFEDDEIIPIMNHFYDGYPKEVQTFLNAVEDFERKLEEVYDRL